MKRELQSSVIKRNSCLLPFHYIPAERLAIKATNYRQIHLGFSLALQYSR